MTRALNRLFRALEENHYNFLKRMATLFADMGKMLADIWGELGAKFEVPPHFETYLNIMLAFASKNS